jgi:heavy metal sensor kinase
VTTLRLSIRTRLTLWYTALLLAIVLVIAALTYSLLRRSLVQDLDASLRLVAQVLVETRAAELTPEDLFLRDFLGREFYDKLVQLLDPEGRMTARSTQLADRRLPLTRQARTAALHGVETFETVELPDQESVRLLTMPVMRNGRPLRLVQVALPMERVEMALRRYLDTLLILVPVGLGLAAIGGALLARSALSPVDTMTRSARRITAEDLRQRVTPGGTGDELDRLADTLNEMLARLDDAFAEMRRFAADAAHELRTPLTALRGGIEVALRAERSSEEYRRVLGSSLEEVDRLVRLAEDLLLFSRFSSGAPMPRDRVELEPLLVEVFDTATRLADGTGVTVRLGPVEPAVVTGDAGALRRALLNVAGNAVKYTPAGGKVELSLTVGDGMVRIIVRDTGVGIAPEDVARIFQPFVRLDTARARSTGGAGLGLAMTRSIVEAHRGRLHVDSSPGAGSTFTVELPLAEAA